MTPAAPSGRNLIQKMRERSGGQDRGPKPPPAAVPTSLPSAVTHACGHTAAFPEIPGDKFREKRFQKEVARDCKACRAAREAENQGRGKANRERKARNRPNLCSPETGVGCRYELDHLGVGRWKGRLVRRDDGVVLGETEATSFRRCMDGLNAAWNAACPAAQGGDAVPATADPGPDAGATV